MYHVSRLAREQVKVALIGQGPDELFGGYRRHLGLRYRRTWSDSPAWLRRIAGPALAAVGMGGDALRRADYALGEQDEDALFRNTLSIEVGDRIDGLFRDGLIEPGSGDLVLSLWGDFMPLLENLDDLGKFQGIEVRSSLPDELLMYADKLSMAHGLELRVPYLDPEIVQFAETLPASLKVNGLRQKRIHKWVCARNLPQSILRRKKRGFAVDVVDSWFRDALSSRFEDLLLDPSSGMYRYLRPQPVSQLLAEHRAGADHHKLLFSLCVFEEWIRCN
jgi:asparagine synthase (glutamine-hydrolysing)